MYAEPLPDPLNSSNGSSAQDSRLEILEYFRRHPAAGDSLEGILDWWLPQQRYETARTAIQRALDDLVEQGLVEEVKCGERKLYRLARKGGGS